MLAQGSRQIFLSVLDAAGNPVPDLTAADVTVLEGDVEAKTVKVEPINWPIKLTVLVDNGSKSSDYLANLRVGLKGMLEAVPDGIEGQLVSLAPQPRWLVRPTPERDKMIKGLDLIAPDAQVAKFFEGLTEAGTRIDKEKGQYYPVIVMVTSDVGTGDTPSERDYVKLQKQITDRAITVHFVLLVTPGGGGSSQTAIGTGLAQVSGGRYEKINASSRLATLLPEIGQQIAKSNVRQTHQYRVTYESAGGGNAAKGISVGISAAKKAVTIKPTLDGRLP